MNPTQPAQLAGAVAVVPATDPARVPVVLGGTGLRARAQQVGARLTNVWIPWLVWVVGRTGGVGLAGIGLLGASGIFLLSTQLPIHDEVAQMRADLAAAQDRAVASPQREATQGPAALSSLPLRSDVPDVLGVLLQTADHSQLQIDTAKYEISAAKAGGLVRYQLSFPVEGPYPQIRQFIDALLVAIPALAIDELSITRKSIADTTVAAQIRVTLFTRGKP